MDILHARVALRDRTLLDVVDLTVRFCVQHGLVYLKLAAIVLTPSFLVTAWLGSTSGWGWGWTCALLLGALAQTPFTVLASRLVFEPSVRLRNVLGASARALPRLLSVRLIQLFGVVFGTLFFMLPGVWIAVLFSFVNEVVVLEQAGLSTSIGRMNRLASGQFGDALMAFLFLLALHIVVVFVGDATGRAALEDLLEITAPPSIFEAHGSVLALAAFWIFVPISATCRFFLYLNVRTRGEGWDIQTRFAAIAARARDEGIAS
jgi:hypothetical protein